MDYFNSSYKCKTRLFYFRYKIDVLNMLEPVYMSIK